MSPAQEAAVAVSLALASMLITVGSLRAMVAISNGSADHWFEPRWKREARLLSHYIPQGDEWGR